MLTTINSTFGVSTFQKIKDTASDVARTAKDYVPLPGTSASAFRSAYDEAMQNIYQLRDQQVILIKEAGKMALNPVLEKDELVEKEASREAVK
jgi:hypothetical protein